MSFDVAAKTLTLANSLAMQSAIASERCERLGRIREQLRCANIIMSAAGDADTEVNRMLKNLAEKILSGE